MLKRWIKRWLGITVLQQQLAQQKQLTKDLVNIGIDVHFKEPAMILIYSRLGGGQIKEVKAEFKDLSELSKFVNELKFKFNTESTTWDGPQMIKQLFKDGKL